MRRELVKTSDGSHSLYIERMDEQYHSKHGAIAEAMKIFIEYGLNYVYENRKTVKIFEVGFGTGLNALLTYMFSQENDLRIQYESVEKYPLGIIELESLNYAAKLAIDQSQFLSLHKAKWSEWVDLYQNFSFKKYEIDLIDMKFDSTYNLIYFDAFAPEKQPKMWSEEIFNKLYNCLEIEGVLVTYCVKGEIRRRLQDIGFNVEKLKGPEGGKREVLRAIKN